MLPLAALAMSLGTQNGETLEGPLSRSLRCSSSISLIPPIPVPTMDPMRWGSSVARSSPLSRTAWVAAATAYWAKRSMRRLSRFSTYWVTSKVLISPAKCTG